MKLTRKDVSQRKKWITSDFYYLSKNILDYLPNNVIWFEMDKDLNLYFRCSLIKSLEKEHIKDVLRLDFITGFKIEDKKVIFTTNKKFILENGDEIKEVIKQE